MKRLSHFPNRDRLSVLTAMIILAYALTRFLDLPARPLTTDFLGSALGFELSGAVLMQILVAALISAGSETLMRSHPYFQDHPWETSIQHWILPGASALVLGAALDLLPDGAVWWSGLGASALALLAVLVAEYFAVDPDETAWDAATLALTGLSYALALILFISLRSLNARAAFSATIGGVVAASLGLRLFILKKTPLGQALLYAGVVGLICAEVIWALSYWRLTATGAGLLALVPFYLSIGLAGQHLLGQLTRRVWIEFAVVGLVSLSVGLFYALGG